MENAPHGLMKGRWYRDTFSQEVGPTDDPREHARLGPISNAAEAAAAAAMERCTYNPEDYITAEGYGLPVSVSKLFVGLVTVGFVAYLTGD
jgi:hypothetical protein